MNVSKKIRILLSLFMIIIFLFILWKCTPKKVSLYSILQNNIKGYSIEKINILNSLSNESITIKNSSDINVIIDKFLNIIVYEYSKEIPFSERNLNKIYYIKIYIKDNSFIGLRIDSSKYIEAYFNGKYHMYKISDGSLDSSSLTKGRF